MSRATNKCPECGGTDIEFGGKIWLNHVRIKPTDTPPHWAEEGTTYYEIVDAVPSMSADDDATGLVWTEDEYLRCCDCDYEIDFHAGPVTRSFFERFKLRGRRYMERRRRTTTT